MEIPGDGAVRIFTLDEDFGENFEVIEYGQCNPEPSKILPPSEASDHWSVDLPSLAYSSKVGLDILDEDADGDSDRFGITRYCKKNDGTDSTPGPDESCKPCEREGPNPENKPHCGNPDPEGMNQFCISPVPDACFPNPQEKHTFPLFKFRMYPEDNDKPLRKDHIIKLFLHPLTLWDIGDSNCDAYYEPLGGGDPIKLGKCDKCSVTYRKGGCGQDDHVQQVNIILLKIPAIDPITDSTSPNFMIGGALPVPNFGFFPTHLSSEWSESDGKKGKYLSTLKMQKNKAREVYVKPWALTGRILHVPGTSNGNQGPFSLQNNLLYIQIVLPSGLRHLTDDDKATVRVTTPSLPGERGAFKCLLLLGGLSVPTSVGFLQQSTAPTGRGTIGSNDYIDIAGVRQVGIRYEDKPVSEGTWSTDEGQPFCEVKLKKFMLVNGGTSLYIPFWVQNPEPLKISDPKNKFRLDVYEDGGVSPFMVGIFFGWRKNLAGPTVDAYHPASTAG